MGPPTRPRDPLASPALVPPDPLVPPELLVPPDLLEPHDPRASPLPHAELSPRVMNGLDADKIYGLF